MLFYFDQAFVLGYQKNKVLLLNPLPKQNMFQHPMLLLKLFGLGEYLKTLVKNKKKRIVLYCDNKSAIAIAKNPVSHERSKHISIKYHFIREAQEKSEIQLHYCQTGEQLADIFTKALPSEIFAIFENALELSNKCIKGECWN